MANSSERQSNVTPLRPAAAGVAVELKHVDKSFHGKQILRNVNLHIEEGQFVAVVGRSGSGKSTLLRLLAGLEHATDGELTLGGRNIEGPSLETTVMFQEALLLPWKTVLDNVGIGLVGDWKPQAEKVLAQVGLTERNGEWPGVLSGGQKQRVALARALVRSPKLLLLDEPLSALDALTRLEMQQLIEDLWLSQGFTTLLVTHDVTEAVKLADRILLVEDGEITMDLPNPLPRPRRHTDTVFATIENQVLGRILGTSRGDTHVDFHQKLH